MRFADQARRHALSPRPVNRPDFVFRLGFHVLINWSAIVTTLIASWRLRGSDLSSHLVIFCVLATAVAWGSFNLMHRRRNRLRNLGLSTAIALALIGAAAYIAR